MMNQIRCCGASRLEVLDHLSVEMSASEFVRRRNEISVLGSAGLLVEQKSLCPPTQIRIFTSGHLLYAADDIWRWLEHVGILHFSWPKKWENGSK